MEVGVWLRRLGLEEYEAAFRENNIDDTILPSLTTEDLKELGVGSVGHRRKLLEAIVALRADTSAKTVPTAPAAAAAPTSAPAAEAAGERRYLTVMFCDLVGSTSISAQLDAEEWRDLIGTYLDAASAAVRERGGHVAKKLGDGLMSLRLSGGAGERRRTRGAGRALDPTRARRGESQERRNWQASTERTHWD